MFYEFINKIRLLLIACSYTKLSKFAKLYRLPVCKFTLNRRPILIFNLIWHRVLGLFKIVVFNLRFNFVFMDAVYLLRPEYYCDTVLVINEAIFVVMVYDGPLLWARHNVLISVIPLNTEFWFIWRWKGYSLVIYLVLRFYLFNS